MVNADAPLAQKVRDSDDVIDRLRKQIEHVVEDEIAKSPEKTECLVKLISASRHLERLADMATHIAEDVIYMVEGEIVRHQHDQIEDPE